MKKNIYFNLLRPDEILNKIKKPSIAIIPLGSMEWHGRHMNMGVDTMNANSVAEKAASIIDGIVLPPLYIGTETERSYEQLKNLGFNGDERIIGVDFPSNLMPSMYFPPKLVEALIDFEVLYLKNLGFKKILLLNGHGADKQIEILNAISKKYTDTKTKVINHLCFPTNGKIDLGHACLLETSLMMELSPNSVKKTNLPPRHIPLKFIQNGFYDEKAINGRPNKDFTVEFDPRDAKAEIGRQSINETIQDIIKLLT